MDRAMPCISHNLFLPRPYLDVTDLDRKLFETKKEKVSSMGLNVSRKTEKNLALDVKIDKLLPLIVKKDHRKTFPFKSNGKKFTVSCKWPKF